VSRERDGRSLTASKANRLIWAIAYDDDDIAQYLQHLAAILIKQMFYRYIEEKYPVARQVLVEEESGSVRAYIVSMQRDMSKRIDDYSKSAEDPEYDAPF